MPEHVQYEDDDLFNPSTHHEESDVPVKPLWTALTLFVIFAAITHAALYFMYKGMLKAEKRRWDPPQTAIERAKDADVPQNQPLLQPFPTHDIPYRNTPVTDLHDMRAREKAVLDHYGWVDQQHGVVHIPIDQAKDLLVAKLAVQASGAPASSPADAGGVPPPPPAPATTTTGGAH
jgi:hypothetical protein